MRSSRWEIHVSRWCMYTHVVAQVAADGEGVDVIVVKIVVDVLRQESRWSLPQNDRWQWRWKEWKEKQHETRRDGGGQCDRGFGRWVWDKERKQRRERNRPWKEGYGGKREARKQWCSWRKTEQATTHKNKQKRMGNRIGKGRGKKQRANEKPSEAVKMNEWMNEWMVFLHFMCPAMLRSEQTSQHKHQGTESSWERRKREQQQRQQQQQQEQEAESVCLPYATFSLPIFALPCRFYVPSSSSNKLTQVLTNSDRLPSLVPGRSPARMQSETWSDGQERASHHERYFHPPRPAARQTHSPRTTRETNRRAEKDEEKKEEMEQEEREDKFASFIHSPSPSCGPYRLVHHSLHPDDRLRRTGTTKGTVCLSLNWTQQMSSNNQVQNAPIKHVSTKFASIIHSPSPSPSCGPYRLFHHSAPPEWSSPEGDNHESQQAWKGVRKRKRRRKKKKKEEEEDEKENLEKTTERKRDGWRWNMMVSRRRQRQIAIRENEKDRKQIDKQKRNNAEELIR